MTSEKRAQKFHTDDAALPDLGSASDWLNQISHTARNQWWRREMSAVFSGYKIRLVLTVQFSS